MSDSRTAAPAAKVDFKKALASYGAPRGTFEIIDVPERRYLMVDGHGDPNTAPEYSAALEALYPVAYRLKFASKTQLGRDYVVPPLEGLWWAADMEAFTAARDKSQWDWTMMILVPEWIEDALVGATIAGLAGADAPARLDDVRLASLAEGRCVQTLHIGSYDDEAAVLERMHTEFIPAQGLRMRGTHHEVYLSDPRRVAPEKLRTILRQPVVGPDEGAGRG
ncbi:hypothetical protein EDF60_1760 [Leucobacter luti]|uniref:GyrI-like domain-containing protein n=1 Tax=Leucobacter luti TaxID=340320 RepID=UPI0010513A86|nr:GyrI-like domain-containing protein [Leucobacter luti]MCW2287109.1 hypothetical protein [Leucobacter luti]TCK41334.1 hypothetical protein EDF60_1760 [Leucobacter luti]